MSWSCWPPSDPPDLPPIPIPPFWGGIGSPPEIDDGEVRPTVDEVARLLRTRTVGPGSEDSGTFNVDTSPTSDEVDYLIDEASDQVLAVLPRNVWPRFWPAVKRLIALRTGATIETSYYRDPQESSSSVATQLLSQYTTELSTLQQMIPRATYIG